MDAFDADALIYAAVPGHPLGARVAALFRSGGPGEPAGTGSVLLLPEVLGKPLRDGSTDEVRLLAGCWPGSICVLPTGPPPSWRPRWLPGTT